MYRTRITLSAAKILWVWLLLISLIISLWAALPAAAAPQATCTWNGTGNWSNTANWSGCGGGLPGAGDDVVVQSGTVTLDMNTAVASVTIDPAAQLSGSSFNLTVTGNWTNNGTFNPGTGTVTFSGTTAQTVQAASQVYLVGPEDFGNGIVTFPPAGWTAENNGFTCGWTNTGNSGLTKFTGTAGNVADANSMWSPCAGVQVDSVLQTPTFSLASAVSPTLTFDHDFFKALGAPVATVEISTTTSPSWTGIVTYNATVNAFESVSLNNYVGSSSVALRFRYTNPGFSNLGQWQIDNVTVSDLSGTAGDHAFQKLVIASGSQVAVGGALTVGDVTDGSGGLHFTDATSSLTAEGLVTNYGTIHWQKDVPSGSATSFDILNAAGDQTQYHGIVITPTTGAMGSTVVEIKGQQDANGCTTTPGEDSLLRRCFNIIPGTVQTATIQYWFTEAERPTTQNANQLELWHWATGTWNKLTGPYQYSETGTTCTSGSGLACWVEVQNVNAYSPFGLGSGSGPTALTLAAFSAGSAQIPIALLATFAFVVMAVLSSILIKHTRTVQQEVRR
ncbi:MAG: hypothetical protein ACE5E7_09565 [Anaerolineae bacterium]